MMSHKAVLKMAYAIMEWEGYWKGSVSYRNNNPGNIKAAGQDGCTGSDKSGHAIFVDFRAGWDALINQIKMMTDGRSTVYNGDMTFYKVFSIYAEANSRAYAEFVAERLKVLPIARLKDVK